MSNPLPINDVLIEFQLQPLNKIPPNDFQTQLQFRTSPWEAFPKKSVRLFLLDISNPEHISEGRNYLWRLVESSKRRESLTAIFIEGADPSNNVEAVTTYLGIDLKLSKFLDIYLINLKTGEGIEEGFRAIFKTILEKQE